VILSIETDRAPITLILDAIGRGDALASSELLPLVYEELRKLATDRLRRERPGQTLQATALVHEVYLRLVGDDSGKPWDGRGHFFAAAAEAMRRILVERARQKASIKHGGRFQRVELGDIAIDPDARPEQVLALDEALDELARHDEVGAKLVSMRYFAGMGHQEAAHSLGLGRREADRIWSVARAWLYQKLSDRD
jgi:RNA polymerase sigma factor (TIGR02999 family)